MCDLGWKSLGVLELTALPTIPAQRWMPWIKQADVFLVDGGDAMFLSHWMRAKDGGGFFRRIAKASRDAGT